MRIKNVNGPILGVSIISYNMLKKYAKQIVDNYSIIVLENDIKMSSIHPKNTNSSFYTSPNKYDLYKELKLIQSQKGGQVVLPPTPVLINYNNVKIGNDYYITITPSNGNNTYIFDNPTISHISGSGTSIIVNKTNTYIVVKTTNINNIFRISVKFKNPTNNLVSRDAGTINTKYNAPPPKPAPAPAPAVPYIPFDYKLGYNESDYTFKSFNRFVEFAKINRLKMRGHTLIYHSAMPSWILNLTREQAIIAIMRHCYNVALYYKTNYPGIIFCYDVVNEHHASPSYNPPWMRKAANGRVDITDTEYIEAACIATHKADPTAKLFLCDYNCESTWGDNQTFDALINLVKSIRNKYKGLNFPIHGLAFQGHYILDLVVYNGLNPLRNNRYISNIQNYIQKTLKWQIEIITNQLGLEFQFTEVDTRAWIDYLDSPPNNKDLYDIKKIYGGNGWDSTAINNYNIMQAEFLKQLYAYMKTNKKCTSFTFWGLNDAVSWLFPDFINWFTMPTLFDINNNPKPSYYALKDIVN